MAAPSSTAAPPYMDTLEQVVNDVIAPAAATVDQTGTFPRPSMEAFGAAGLLGLISATEVGGLGQGHRAAALVIDRVAQACGSTAMVLCMQYAATAVLEVYGPRTVHEALAAGQHLSTLAFSEAGSRSHFWALISTAALVAGDGIVHFDD